MTNHCEDHRAYLAGCVECQCTTREYQRRFRAGERAAPRTGLRSDSNWARFNDIGMRSA